MSIKDSSVKLLRRGNGSAVYTWKKMAKKKKTSLLLSSKLLQMKILFMEKKMEQRKVI